ncbi:sulfurtransferase [Oceanospirillum sediminis]|uniref:Sulfurtransferase n=1 Tax=Oceanospirillum sediminis TaxID=2760088 RepID=A0A839IR96_9GAMM|nr:sulfurtransferase [Oceanospirillum sediminis]MBB1487220.1 sulfurtransferase [Oceanospirillum sediminis]
MTQDAIHQQNTLISVQTLQQHLSQDTEHPVIIDCRFAMAAQPMPDAGQEAYLNGHIPGAVYADLDRQLSDPVKPGLTGRHPLPSSERLMAAFKQWGIRQNKPVVVYDQNNSSMAAARAWWLLRFAGLTDVRVLNGGLDAWQSQGLALETQENSCSDATDFQPEWQTERLVTARDIEQGNPDLVDARSRERFAGQAEPIDPVAGHIPGASCLPFTELVDSSGFFLPENELRQKLTVFKTPDPVAYCGSGVTACHLILACVAAGLPEPRLYAGSWSEWITQDRAVATE